MEVSLREQDCEEGDEYRVLLSPEGTGMVWARFRTMEVVICNQILDIYLK